MDCRTVEIAWLPRSAAQWRAFTAARIEAGRLWGDLVVRHHRLRRLNWRWPSKARWQRWARGRYPGLSAQSAQQLVGEFCEAVRAGRRLRQKGHAAARYPWRTPRYRDVVYTNQDARLRGGALVLPNGVSGRLRLKLPRDRPLPGRLMQVRLGMGRVVLVCEVEGQPRQPSPAVGCDLGVNTLIAATDGRTALLVSGREAKATVQWRNKRLASLAARQARQTKGSSRWRRLRRRRAKLQAKARRRLADLAHKATRLVARAFPEATCYVGKPFNGAARRLGRIWAQQVSQAANGKIIAQLAYKTGGAHRVDEAWTSQTCPSCGRRSKSRRVYRCRGCGIVAPRDVVGATNILSVGRTSAMRSGTPLPTSVRFTRPVDVSRRKPGSSLGHRASSSLQARSPRH